MFAKPPPTSFTLNSKERVPDPPGHEIPNESRPPPKVYYPYRDCHGISPKQIEKMIQKKKLYEQELERIQTENDIAQFEAKLKGSHSSPENQIPTIPLPSNIDLDLLRSFEPPSATRFYDYVPPNTRCTSTHKKKVKSQMGSRNTTRPGTSFETTSRTTTRPSTSFTSNLPDIETNYDFSLTQQNTNRTTISNNSHQSPKGMSHGCPCCNPDHFHEIQPKRRPATRNGKPIQRPTTATPRKKPNLPKQMCQAYWNVLDEPSIPARPKNVYVEKPKPVQFSMLRTGPRPGGIPIVINDLAACREAGEKWFENEMAKKKDKELYKREQTLHNRSTASRNFNLSLKEQTNDLAVASGQRTINDINSQSNSIIVIPKPVTPTKEEQEAIDELSKYDDKLYQEYQAKKRPTDEMELLLQQSNMRVYN